MAYRAVIFTAWHKQHAPGRTCTHAQCGMRLTGPLLPGSGLQQCAACRQVAYCSKACQTMKWKKHKKECATMSTAGGMRGFTQQALLRQPQHTAHRLTQKVNVRVIKMLKELEEGNDAQVLMNPQAAASRSPNLCRFIYGHRDRSRECRAVPRSDRALGQSDAHLRRDSKGRARSQPQDGAAEIFVFSVRQSRPWETGDRECQGVSCLGLALCHQELGQHETAITLFAASSGTL
jgi:hypothetical protein